MEIELTAQQRAAQQAFRAFVEAEISPHADQWDQEQKTPARVIKQVGELGYLGALVGPQALDMITFGLLNEELGRGCSSIRSLITVHSMMCFALQRWGSKQQQERWLSRLASGEMIGAFALSEPLVGSDASSVETTAVVRGDDYVLNGRKKWITYGQIADLYLLFARCDGRVSAFLVERDTPGFDVKPIDGLIGTRASMAAELILTDCVVPKAHLIGGRGFGLASVATSALDIGRYSVAWGCVGIAQACLEASLQYAQTRKQFGVYLKEHQLIQRMLTDMITNVKAARLLCLNAGYLKETGSPDTIMETWIAKYFASTAATKISGDAVQLHGANGCSSDYAVQRYWRDSKVMEVIEGSTQIQQITIANYGYQMGNPNTRDA